MSLKQLFNLVLASDIRVPPDIDTGLPTSFSANDVAIRYLRTPHFEAEALFSDGLKVKVTWSHRKWSVVILRNEAIMLSYCKKFWQLPHNIQQVIDWLIGLVDTNQRRLRVLAAIRSMVQEVNAYKTDGCMTALLAKIKQEDTELDDGQPTLLGESLEDAAWI